ncbi:hypothetical protein PHYBLDRAFT_132627 [Phycomyces blakesleeanus NRRL 1555(-)]|uniref:FYVE-type domain-containing protein n=2 Tax=Phycomyces blakesleeanus TaxID=4837 RepID=A0A167N8T3_PHYB8|nr:hypothetical protein PHYBLDRAFT_132627 [Phycomyces blakesleeanus NRRL 1555(-)]OAD75350.1 hypothetical protein PHYBLDRAFT_132627 [Phycomyces blakesleeanus NRRL 1555(-)]|eukprot:XP_018293390.1 hypothetical protein PHYBLDRAFT_132627 [Phycomyces blakesleeanus NRRL 1555(-)]
MTSTTTSTAIDANPWSPDNGENWQEQEDASLNQVDLAGQAEDGPRSYDWESDIDARDCRRCSRKFGFLVRRHHCRRCGLIVCDRCSNSRAYLSPSQILQDPSLPQESRQVLASQHQRVCDKCYADLGI